MQSWTDSLVYLSNQINTFSTEYIKALSSDSDVVKITDCAFNLQEIDIYNSDCYLADHTLGNLLSCHVLMTITNLLYEYTKEDEELFHELYSCILISYIAPDESAITRTIKLKFQTPEHPGFNEFIHEKYASDKLAKNTKLCILYGTTIKLITYLRAQL